MTGVRLKEKRDLHSSDQIKEAATLPPRYLCYLRFACHLRMGNLRAFVVSCQNKAMTPISKPYPFIHQWSLWISVKASNYHFQVWEEYWSTAGIPKHILLGSKNFLELRCLKGPMYLVNAEYAKLPKEIIPIEVPVGFSKLSFSSVC